MSSVVTEAGKSTQGLMVTVLGVAVVISALGVVYAKFESRTLFAELQKLSKAQDRMDVEWGQLQLEQSTWSTHGRIESQARTRLEMVLPEQEKVVVIRP